MRNKLISVIENYCEDFGIVTDKKDLNNNAETLTDYLLHNGALLPKYSIYSTVWIIDYFDVDNQCSQIGSGKGSGNIERRVRECFVTSISQVARNDFLYYVQPRKITQRETNGFDCYFWEKSFCDNMLYSSQEEAEKALNNIKTQRKEK